MTRFRFAVALVFGSTAVACSDGMMSSPTAPATMSMMGSQPVFQTNGETIFRTGRNLQGVTLQDLARSRMSMPHSCASCHGADGTGGMPGSMMGSGVPSTQFRDLSDPRQHAVPYTEESLTRRLNAGALHT